MKHGMDALFLRLDLAGAFALLAVVAGFGGLDATLVRALFALGFSLQATAGGFGYRGVFLVFSVNSGGDESANRESENET